jgi:hypothetical protein
MTRSPSILLVAHSLHFSVKASEPVYDIVVCKFPQHVQDSQGAILGELITVQAIVFVPSVS